MPIKSSKKAQHKIVEFLKDEIHILKTNHMINIKKNTLKQRNVIKKQQIL